MEIQDGSGHSPHHRPTHPPVHHLLQDSRQHHPRRVRAHLRSEAHHRIYAPEGTGEEGSDKGHWKWQGEEVYPSGAMYMSSRQP